MSALVSKARSFARKTWAEIKRQVFEQFPSARKGGIAILIAIVLAGIGLIVTKVGEKTIESFYPDKTAGEKTATPTPKPTKVEPIPVKLVKEESAGPPAPLLKPSDIQISSIKDPPPDWGSATRGVVPLPKAGNFGLKIASFDLISDPANLIAPPRLQDGVKARKPVRAFDFLSAVSYQDCVRPTEAYAFKVIAQRFTLYQDEGAKAEALRIIDLAAGLGNKRYSEANDGELRTDAGRANALLMAIDAFKLGRSRAMYARLKKVVRKWNAEDTNPPSTDTPTFDITLQNDSATPQLLNALEFRILAHELPAFEGAGDGEYRELPFRVPVAAEIKISATTRRTVAKFGDPVVLAPRGYMRLKVAIAVPELDGDSVAGWLGYLSFRQGNREVGRSPTMCSIVFPTEREPAFHSG
jgi:hypothetical protein